MDPDLVRQQAEEEAASRHLSRRDLPPGMRIEPVLPLGVKIDPRRVALPGELYRAGMDAAATVVAAGWRTALGIAASCVLGTTVGLVGGIMVGVKLQLVPWQGAAIGAAAGFVIGWQVASVALVKRGGLGHWRAASAGFRATLLVLIIMAAAMFVLPHFIGAPVAPNAPFDIAVFWKSVAAGAMVAIILGGVVMRGALRQAIAADQY
jgi:hypothetical protein